MSCIKEQEVTPIDKWWLKECTNEYITSGTTTTYRFCWSVKLMCDKAENEVQRCFYTNCEILTVIQRDYPNCKVVNISKI